MTSEDLLEAKVQLTDRQHAFYLLLCRVNFNEAWYIQDAIAQGIPNYRDRKNHYEDFNEAYRYYVERQH